MSQASNQVKWCIIKAKKEIEECEKQGKRKKHRGLLEISESIEIAKQHIEKAKHNLKAVNFLLKGDFSDLCISTLFYAMYHCFLAIASKFGYESRNQTCTIALIEWLKEEGKIEIDDKYLDMLKYADVVEKEEDSVIEMREESTYGIELSAENMEKINQLIEDCKRLIDSTMEILHG
ncbi:MAG: HEPN domain-containing protein [Nanoarchaeota archaeon]|nr:HEPN domain-containing protein [Nanoarchaeota archaeon]MBU1704969.1 HEPN domain-containing protein [Nanoarchaeota archaeon]